MFVSAPVSPVLLGRDQVSAASLKANLATAHAKILCDYGKRMVVFWLKNRARTGGATSRPLRTTRYQAADCVIECVVGCSPTPCSTAERWRPNTLRLSTLRSSTCPARSEAPAGPRRTRNYAGRWRDACGAAAAIAAEMLSGRVKARYSAAYSGGRISTMVSFSTHTSITWNGPRLQRKHCQP